MMDHKPEPLITIIVAVFNGAKTLQQCIDSIAQQTYPNKDLIIIDGGSTDGTVELLESSREHFAYWVSEPDKGIYNAWNKGLKRAKGDWILFLGADDFFWNEHVLERLTAVLDKVPTNINVAYGQVMLLGTDEKNLYAVGKPWGQVKRRFQQAMSIPHQGVIHRRSLFEQYGGFDESFRIVGDYELLLRELKTGEAAFIPDIIVAGMRQGGISSSSVSSLALLHEVRRAQVMHGLKFPGWIWLLAVVRVYIRLLLWRILGEKQARKMLDMGRCIMGLPKYWTKT